MTTESNTAATSSSEESVTKVHKEEQNDGKVTFQIYQMYCKKIKNYNIIPCVHGNKTKHCAKSL